MLEEKQDVEQAEITAPESSTETKSPEVKTSPASEGDENTQEEITTEEASETESKKTVPYSRFKEVNNERKLLKELLDEKQSSETPKEEALPSISNLETSGEFNEEEDETKRAWSLVNKIAEQKAKKAIGSLKDELELQNTMRQYTDFSKYVPQIKEIVKGNPATSWSDAYKIAKFDDSGKEAFEQGRKEASEKIDEANSATAESAKKATSKKSGVIDVMDRSISLDEIEAMLPHS